MAYSRPSVRLTSRAAPVGPELLAAGVPADSGREKAAIIWVLPDREGISPRYDQKTFSDSEKRGRLRLIGSPDGREGSIVIHQDVEIFAALLDAGDAVTHALSAGRKGWVQVVRGAGEVNGTPVRAGDGVALEGEATLAVTSRASDAEFLVFDLPPQ